MKSFKLSLLALSLGFSLLAGAKNPPANNTTPQAGNTPAPVTVNSPAEREKLMGVSLEEAKKNPHYRNTGVPAGTPIMDHPNERINEQMGRFGEWRGNRSHKGMDLNSRDNAPNLPLFARTDGIYIGPKWNGRTAPTIQRPNGDWIVYGHAMPKGMIKSGSPVGANTVLAVESGGGQKNGVFSWNAYGRHLHLEYHIKKDKNARARFFVVQKSGDGIKGSGRAMDQLSTQTSRGLGYFVTDPTPYYSKDWKITQGLFAQTYLGNSARWQFNTLYGTSLPVGAGTNGPTKQIPLTRLQSLRRGMGGDVMPLTADEMAMANMSLVNGAMIAEDLGYDIGGYMVSHRVLASIFGTEDGVNWSLDEYVSKSPSPMSMTPDELAESIANKRYGNMEWLTNMMKLNTRGVMTELIAIQADKKVLEKDLAESEREMERLLSAYLSIKNRSQEMLNQAMAQGIEKKIMPNMIRGQLEKRGDEYVDQSVWVEGGGSTGSGNSSPPVDFNMDMIPADLRPMVRDLLEGVAHGESKSYNAYNNGTACGTKSYPRGDGKVIIENMTPAETLQYQNAPCGSKLFAVGKYQIIPQTMDMILKVRPDLRHKKMTPEVQEEMGLILMMIKRPKVADFILHGKGTVEQAQYQLALEWASIPVPQGFKLKNGTISNGTSTYYTGGGNRANQQSGEMVRKALLAIQAQRNNRKNTPANPTNKTP